MRTFHRVIMVATLAALAACGGADQGSQSGAAGTGEVGSDSGMVGMSGMEGMTGMPGMGGMSGMGTPGAGPMEEMQSHMGMMMGVSPDSMLAMMLDHRQMAANMLAQMNREMQQMNMMGDSAWIVTVDSIRQDLVVMPGMSAGQVSTFMAEHRARMTRLMEMHRSMMGNMGR